MRAGKRLEPSWKVSSTRDEAARRRETLVKSTSQNSGETERFTPTFPQFPHLSGGKQGKLGEYARILEKEGEFCKYFPFFLSISPEEKPGELGRNQGKFERGKSSEFGGESLHNRKMFTLRCSG